MTRALLSVLLCAVLPAAAGVEPLKTLRVAFPVAEDGFDPARVRDFSSQTVNSQIFESLYTYDYLAVPPVVRPLVAAGLPEASADFRVWTIRIRPGVFFTPDRAFAGQPRELVAADVVYTLKRHADPAVRSPFWTGLLQQRIMGLEALHREALTGKKPFDYERPIDGLRVVDRYTLQIRLLDPRPRFTHILTHPGNGLVAREVVEAYRERTMEHPVGTGPFMLASWRRSSQIVLVRNPGYREVRFDAQPAANDAEAVAIAERLKGRRLPMVDRVEISIIAENQPRWLAFIGGNLDEIEVPGDFLRWALPNGEVAPYLKRRGVQAHTVARALVHYLYFNMTDAIVGGYTSDKVALRRAISLGIDVERYIRVGGAQGVVAHSPIAANLTGFDPAFRSDNGVYDSARAKALLDTYGYVDRDGDGWRDLPSGAPLVLRMSTQTSQISRQQDEMFERYMSALGIKVVFRPALWQDNFKNARAGKLMMWHLGDGAAMPDGLSSLHRLYGPSIGGSNFSRFNLPEFNAIYEELVAMSDGDERKALFDRAKRLAVAYQPEKTTIHGVVSYMNQPWLIGYRRNAFGPGWYHMVDIDLAGAPQK